jgi:hypothetical protein
MRAVALAVTIIATNITSTPGQIGANFFDGLNESQVWINVEPRNLEGGRSPIVVNATVSFPGRTLAAAPASVELRAQAYCYEFLNRVRQPVFSLIVDGVPVPLDTPDKPVQANAACGNGFGSVDVVITRLGFPQFLAIAAAREVIVDALGFHTQLTASDLQALGMFARTVAAGVSIK